MQVQVKWPQVGDLESLQTCGSTNRGHWPIAISANLLLADAIHRSSPIHSPPPSDASNLGNRNRSSQSLSLLRPFHGDPPTTLAVRRPPVPRRTRTPRAPLRTSPDPPIHALHCPSLTPAQVHTAFAVPVHCRPSTQSRHTLLAPSCLIVVPKHQLTTSVCIKLPSTSFAPSSMSPPPASQISPSGELYRAIERGYSQDRRGQSRPAGTANSVFATDLAHEPSRNSLLLDDLDAWPTPPSAASLPSLRSTASLRSSPRMSGTSGAGSRYSRTRIPDWALERRRIARQDRGNSNDASAMTDSEARRPMRASARTRPRLAMDGLLSGSFNGSNSNLQDYLDDYTHTTRDRLAGFATSTSSRPRPAELPDDNRRAKRRKLDSDRISSSFAGFRYGRYGQVEPGALTMEIVSCDGGVLPDDSRRYAVENILKNDPTVYCTEGSRCNIVLRHQGATVFTLQELVIKAPRSNYTAPVQEGMVFVAMHADHILTRTAQYQIQYSSVRLSPRDSLHNHVPIISVRHNADGTTMTNAQVRARRLYEIGRNDEDQMDVRVAQIPPEFRTVTLSHGAAIEYGDEDTDDVDSHEWHTDSWRSRRANDRHLGPTESESSEEDDALDVHRYAPDDRPDRRRGPHNAALAEAAEAAQVATQEAVRAVGGEMLAPNARFFIERDKSKCTITFDPPVSGRFVLLKMWSPHQDPAGNIDIQAVVTKGFAGPRYFPSIELR
ncbi:hypothetical protein MN608_02278 [Microdochium nivale]|nr:hypothetical protein MN608_02278 [Microdochium nivale]